MKRSILIALAVAVAAVAGWAQDATGDHVPGEVPDGERHGGFFQAPDPEMQAQRVEAEVEIWDRFLSLTEEQQELVIEIITVHSDNLTEIFTASFTEGTRPDPSVMQAIQEQLQILQEEKAFEIYEILTADQQAILQYYYEEITAEISAAGRSGPGGGTRRPR